MIVLLPPSETKRSGGRGAPLDLAGLRFPQMLDVRQKLCAELVTLCNDPIAAARALKLGPSQSGAITRNLSLMTTPTMPALLRYSGVLYDAFDAASLSERQWVTAASLVIIQSALFGPVSADDRLPDYRLSHDSRLVPSLKARWSAAGADALKSVSGIVVDLRSEGYAALSPLPIRPGAHYVRVVASDGNGRVRALNHFNKQAKGLFARALVDAGHDFASTSQLLEWASDQGYDLTLLEDTTLSLCVTRVTGSDGRLRTSLRVE